MRVRYEDLLDFAHLDGAPLYLVLRRLAAIKQPDITDKSESK